MTQSHSLPPAVPAPAQAVTDGPGSSSPAGAVLFHLAPTEAELVIARGILRRGMVDDRCVERCCATLARSKDAGDRKLATEVRRARLWVGRAESATRILDDAELSTALDVRDHSREWDDAPEYVSPGQPDSWGAAVKIILALAAATVVLIWAGALFGAAMEAVPHMAGPYGLGAK